MLGNFILFIQNYLLIGSVLLFFLLIQPEYKCKIVGTLAILFSFVIIVITFIPNYFNKAYFLNLLALIIVLVGIAYISVAYFNNRFADRIKVITLAILWFLIILQGIIQLFDTIQSIFTHGHSIIERDSLIKIGGYLLGLFFLFIWDWGLNKGFSEMSKKHQLVLFKLLLLVFIAKQLGLALLWVYQNTILLDFIPNIFQVISYLVNQGLLFLYVFLFIIVLFSLALNIKSRNELDEKGLSPAQRRKKIALARKKRRAISFLVVLVMIALGSTTILKKQVIQEEVLSEPEAYETDGKDILIPLKKVSDGNLHRYEYRAKAGTPIRFIVIEKSPGAYGIGLDACEICGVSGYIQRGDTIVCKLCDVVMNKATIGFKGGCNPIPLSYEIKNQTILIHKLDLDGQESVFK